jgi:ATP-dependent protease HslVU (ClpYQ) peptidase subunit
MGCDSAVGDGWLLLTVRNPKIFQVGECLIGVAGSPRMAQILRYHLIPPSREESESDNHYIIVKFAEAVRSCFKEQGFAKVESNREEGGFFLLGYRGELYSVESNYAVLHYANDTAALGIGRMVALGALLALTHLEPEPRIQRALEVVGQLSDGVLPPYHVQVMDNG